MAIMIPALDTDSIKNWGERAFYRAAQALPRDYTVLYSYKYRDKNASKDYDAIREADFVIVHPSLGFLVVEVKQGDIDCRNGVWYEYKNGTYLKMHKNPVEQARNAAFAILSAYEEKMGHRFSLSFRYAIAFPECSRLQGEPPADLNPDSIFLFDDLDRLEDKIFELFNKNMYKSDARAADFLVDRVLAPSFKVFAGLEDRINIFHKESKRVLTEEQERILEETELNRHMLFLGSAGSGKTFVAMEKAKRLVFSVQADLKVRLSSSEVVYSVNLLKTINKYKDEVISDSIKEEIISRIDSSNIEDKALRREHIDAIRRSKQEKAQIISNGFCPKCGGVLLVRKGRYGEFKGCSNFPKCKFTI